MSTPDLRDKLDGIHHFNKLEAIYPENLSRHPSSRVPTNKVRSSEFLLIPKEDNDNVRTYIHTVFEI